MVSEEIETKPMVLEEKTNEETNVEGTRIVRTKQPEIIHGIKYSKHATCNKYNKFFFKKLK